MEFLAVIEETINYLLNLLGSFGAVLGCVFILFESIIPILPLSVFITLNFITFGSLLGFIISWIFTVAGCMLSYYIFRTGVNDKYFKKLKDNESIGKIIKVIENMSFNNLVLILAIPFTPAFAVNIAAGVTRINPKKYFYALLLGKISLVYFWGFVGVGLIDSIKNPSSLIKIAIAVLIVYIVSIVVSKKLKIK